MSQGYPHSSSSIPPQTPSGPLPPKKGNGCLIAGILGGVFALLLIGGCTALTMWGFGIYKSQAMDSLNLNPVIQEHLGEVLELDTDLVATGEQNDPDAMAFRAKGTKGNGLVIGIFETTYSDSEELTAGTLKLPSGEVFDLITGESSGTAEVEP